jgi:LacI family transcriptional regulator
MKAVVEGTGPAPTCDSTASSASTAIDRDRPARATLRDVARQAGVSRTTASFVLTGRQDMRVATDTKQRVLRIARALDYRPNLVARSLRTSQSVSLGLISDGVVGDAFAGGILRSSLGVAARRGHLMFIGEPVGVGAMPTGLEQLVHDMLDRGVAGFLYVADHTRRLASIPAVLTDHPLVLVNCTSDSADVPMVVPDEDGGGRTAIAALLSHGHLDRIVLVGETPPDVVAAAQRKAGIDAVLTGHGLTLAAQLACQWQSAPAYAVVRDHLDAGQRPSALICLNDRIALGAYLAIRDAGLGVPGDLSVISFDDSDLAGWLQPELTSVAIPHDELGRHGVELLLDPNRAAGAHRIPMPIRNRHSLGPPAAPAQLAASSRYREVPFDL